MSRIFVLFIILFSLNACSVQPEAIDYGNEQCAFCSMSIVDNRHAAQLVTETGKQYKYDAIECLIKDIENFNEPKLAHLLIANYANPGEMINAKEATYLISTSIKSPMGANLSGFVNKELGVNALNNNEGQFYNWSAIKNEINK